MNQVSTRNSNSGISEIRNICLCKVFNKSFVTCWCRSLYSYPQISSNKNPLIRKICVLYNAKQHPASLGGPPCGPQQVLASQVQPGAELPFSLSESFPPLCPSLPLAKAFLFFLSAPKCITAPGLDVPARSGETERFR